MTGDEGTELADVIKAARNLEGLFGSGAVKEALRRATNAGASGSTAAEMQWQRVAKYLAPKVPANDAHRQTTQRPSTESVDKAVEKP